MADQFEVCNAAESDMGDVMRMIQELANFEKFPDGPRINADVLIADGFGAHPLFRCIVARRVSNPSDVVGYALFFYTYSTWEGKVMFLEDLYVTPVCRKQGLGTKLFTFVAQIARTEGCVRMDLHVLDWNPAREMYERFGARNLTGTEGWLFYRLDKTAIDKLTETSNDNSNKL